MKYININDIRLFVPIPMNRLDVFTIETVDAALGMCEGLFQKINEEYHARLDFATFKYELLKRMIEFTRVAYTTCEDFFEVPHKMIEDHRYKAIGIHIEEWPQQLHKQSAENYFLIQYCMCFANVLFRYMKDCVDDEKISYQVGYESQFALGKWIVNNCIKSCNYECIRRASSNGYCTLCSYMIQALPCPKKGEVKYQYVGIVEEECNCLRKEM